MKSLSSANKYVPNQNTSKKGTNLGFFTKAGDNLFLYNNFSSSKFFMDTQFITIFPKSFATFQEVNAVLDITQTISAKSLPGFRIKLIIHFKSLLINHL